MRTRPRPALLVMLAVALVLCAVWVAPLLASPAKGQIGGPTTRALGPPDEGTRTTPALVIGRGPQAKGHMEIVSYGWRAPKDSGATDPNQLCTSIEYVPGNNDFGSCASVAEMTDEKRTVQIELSQGQLTPKAEQNTEIGGLLAPGVAAVEVRFHRHGQAKLFRISATVTQVSGELQERLGQPHPFGYFVARVKGLVALRAMKVLAFDSEGKLIATAHRLGTQPVRLG